MNISRDSFDSPGFNSSPESRSRRFFAVGGSEVRSSESVVSLDDFVPSGGIPSTSNLSDVLRQAGVPKHDAITSKCYAHAEKIMATVSRLGVTIDDAAAIISFTIEADTRESSPYYILNRALADRNATRVRAVTPYAMTLARGLRKLMHYTNITGLYRGIDCAVNCAVGTELMWMAFSSASRSKDVVVKNFLNNNAAGSLGTLFVISDGWGYDIREFSFYNEAEILFEIEWRLRVTNVIRGKYTEIHVKMIDTNLVFRDAMGRPVLKTPGPPPPGHHCGPPQCPYCHFRPSGPPPHPPRGPPPPCPRCKRVPPRPPGPPPPGPPRGPPPPCPYCGCPRPPPPCPKCGRVPPPPPGFK